MGGRIANAGDGPARLTLIVLGPSADPPPHAAPGAAMPAAGGG
jgi:hypothetical protein